MDRRQKNILPTLPDASEREQIKAEYLKKHGKSTLHVRRE